MENCLAASHRALVLQKMLPLLRLTIHRQSQDVQPLRDSELLRMGSFHRIWQIQHQQLDPLLQVNLLLRMQAMAVVDVELARVPVQEGMQVKEGTRMHGGLTCFKKSLKT